MLSQSRWWTQCMASLGGTRTGESILQTTNKVQSDEKCLVRIQVIYGFSTREGKISRSIGLQ